MLEAARARGKDVKALDERPEILPGLEPVWDAWLFLARSRRSGLGPDPISVTDALAYLSTVGYSRRTQLYMLQIIQSVDRVFLEHVAKKQERAKNANSGTGNRRPAGTARGGKVPKRRY